MIEPGSPSGPFRASDFYGREVRPRVWNVRDLIPGGTVTMFTGDGGSGKSTLALQLAVATAADAPWLGRSPKVGPVLYVSAEDDLDELHRRCIEIARGMGVELSALVDLHLWPVADADALLATEGAGGKLAPTRFWSRIEAAAVEVAPVLIVLDPLADLFGGNENDRSQARQFISMIRRLAMKTGAAVLLISHPSQHGMTYKTGTSGSTAWSNSVRSRLYLTRPDGEDPDLRVLGLMKANYGAAQPAMRLRRLSGGFQIEAGGQGLSAEGRAAQVAVDDLFLKLLDHLTAEGRKVGDTPSRNWAPKVFANDPRANGVAQRGFADAMGRLFAAGAIKVETSGPPSKPTSRIVRVVANTA